MNYRTLYAALALTFAMIGGGCSRQASEEAGQDNLTQYVDPYIGTGDHGHVFLGANIPFGLVQLGPTQHNRGWDWCSGYHDSDSIIVGFGHMHLSGTGIGDLGDVSLFPMLKDGEPEARFSHQQEEVRPGYYAVTFADTGIRTELTATARTGMHRYTFPAETDTPQLRINLKQGIGWDAWKESKIEMESDTVITGYRYSSGWAKDQRIYFCARFSRPISSSCSQGDTVAVLSFNRMDEPLLVKVALSPVSVENARLNMRVENPYWNFDACVAEADKAWNEQLAKILITTDDERQKRIFYTALYHTMTAPSVYNDVTGDYRGADGEVHRNADFTNYTTLSLWDTYRAAHPLSTLIHHERQRDFAQTLLHIYQEQGKLPVWHLMGNETDCMVGNPGIPVLADIVLKGYDVDAQKALEAMKASAMLDERSLHLLKKYGYIPFDLEPTNETTAKGMEYALADGCVARVAEKVGDKEAAEYFGKRSRSYQKYFDKATGFMRGLSSEGKFSEPFDPFYTAPGKGDYTEGNAWQYIWLVPHDVQGLINLFGSDERFVRKLDSLFVVEGNLGAEAAPDVSGLVGQYAHGNEPSHHVIYLYHYAGLPWKAAPLLRQVMNTLYQDAPAGLCGNEDVGQMSAWYVLSSIGLYQVEPAGGRYIIGSPLFDSACLNVGDGKTFEVRAVGNSDKNIYVQSARLNGKPYTKSYIDFDDIKAGGVLELQMGDVPQKDFGCSADDRP